MLQMEKLVAYAFGICVGTYTGATDSSLLAPHMTPCNEAAYLIANSTFSSDTWQYRGLQPYALQVTAAKEGERGAPFWSRTDSGSRLLRSKGIGEDMSSLMVNHSPPFTIG